MPRPLRSQTLRVRLRRRRRIRLAASVLAVFVFIGALAMLSRISLLVIESVEVVGGEGIVTDPVAVQKAVMAELHGEYLWLFARRNRLIYSQTAITTAVQSSYPRIKKIGFAVSDNILRLSIAEREPYALWCSGEPPWTDLALPAEAESIRENECYFMDETGLLFAKAPEFSRDITLTYFGELAHKTSNPAGDLLNSIFLSSERLAELKSFLVAMEGLNLTAKAVATNERDLIILFKNGTRALVSRERPFAESLSDLSSALSSGQLMPKDSGPAPRYIDLRFENRVYFKPAG